MKLIQILIYSLGIGLFSMVHSSCQKNKNTIYHLSVQDTLTFPGTWSEIKAQKTYITKEMYNYIIGNQYYSFQARTPGYFLFDFDHNGRADFSIYIDDQEEQVIGQPKQTYTKWDCRFGHGLESVNIDSGKLDVISYGTKLTEDLNWAKLQILASTNKPSKIAGKGPCFIGFRHEVFKNENIFDSNYGYLYGWMKLEVSADCHQVIVHDWAISSLADREIKVGQKE